LQAVDVEQGRANIRIDVINSADAHFLKKLSFNVYSSLPIISLRRLAQIIDFSSFKSILKILKGFCARSSAG